MGGGRRSSLSHPGRLCERRCILAAAVAAAVAACCHAPHHQLVTATCQPPRASLHSCLPAAERALLLAGALGKAGFKPHDRLGIYAGRPPLCPSPGGRPCSAAIAECRCCCCCRSQNHVVRLAALPIGAAAAEQSFAPPPAPLPLVQPTAWSGCCASAPPTSSAAPSVSARAPPAAAVAAEAPASLQEWQAWVAGLLLLLAPVVAPPLLAASGALPHACVPPSCRHFPYAHPHARLSLPFAAPALCCPCPCSADLRLPGRVSRGVHCAALWWVPVVWVLH